MLTCCPSAMLVALAVMTMLAPHHVEARSTPQQLLLESEVVDCFLSMGNWGRNNEHVQQLAASMDAMAANPQVFGCRQVVFLFALGDNFYETGVRNTTDPQWNATYRSQFRDSTKTPALAALPFYVLVGNHDYGSDRVTVFPDNIQAQVDYSDVDALWRCPDKNYTINITMSGVRMHFVVMNTEPMHLCADGSAICFQQDEPRWVDATLEAVDNDTTVDVVATVGHHNLFSPIGGHVDLPYDALLSPILERHRVAFSLSGHSHFVAWGKSPNVTTVNDEAAAGAFPGAVWYVTNGAARGSAWNNCSWGDGNPLVETYCAPAEDNVAGAFLLHRVVVAPSQDAPDGASFSSGNTSSYVEHCMIRSVAGTMGDCVRTPFRPARRQGTIPVTAPSDNLSAVPWPEMVGIVVVGALSVLGTVILMLRAIRTSRRRHALIVDIDDDTEEQKLNAREG